MRDKISHEVWHLEASLLERQRERLIEDLKQRNISLEDFYSKMRKLESRSLSLEGLPSRVTACFRSSDGDEQTYKIMSPMSLLGLLTQGKAEPSEDEPSWDWIDADNGKAYEVSLCMDPEISQEVFLRLEATRSAMR